MNNRCRKGGNYTVSKKIIRGMEKRRYRKARKIRNVYVVSTKADYVSKECSEYTSLKEKVKELATKILREVDFM